MGLQTGYSLKYVEGHPTYMEPPTTYGGFFEGDLLMKLIIRIFALTLIVAAAVAGNSAASTSASSSSIHSSVPGGGGPMPFCNPFTSACPPIR